MKQILQKTEKEFEPQIRNWGWDIEKLSLKDIAELLKGNAIEINDGEYSTILVLEKTIKE